MEHDPTNGAAVLTVCESRRQVEWLAKRQAPEKMGQLVAANPDAAWALKQRGLTFRRLEDYDDRRSVDEIEGLLKAQIEWARWVDAFLQERVPDFKRLNFRPARTCLLWLKNPWDTCIHRAALLDAVARRAQPSEVSFFANRRPVSFDKRLAMRGSMLAESIPGWAAHWGIALNELPAVSGDAMWAYEYTHIGLGIDYQLSRARQGLERQYHSLRKLVARWNGIFSTAGQGSDDARPCLILKPGYDLTAEVAARLQAHGLRLLGFEDIAMDPGRRSPSGPDPEPALADAWNVIRSQEAFWRPRGWQDWSFRPVLEPVFRHFWFTVIPVLLRSMKRSIGIIEERRPRAIVLATLGGPEHFGLLMAAHALSVPVVMYLHGVSVGDLEVPTIDLGDRYWGQFILTYGTGQSTFIQGRPPYDDGNATPISVGSARNDDVRRRGGSEIVRSIRTRISGKRHAPIVLYVPGPFVSNNYRFESNDFRDIRCFDVRTKIAALFARHPEVRFVYKSFLSQGHDPTLDMFATICPRCVVVGNIPLTDLQWAADALIHEIPSSGLAEGLLTEKPVIAWADRDVYRMSSQAKAMLRKRVTLAETDEEFVRSVESLLVEASYAPVVNPDQEFLRTFVTHLNDGASACRAADVIYGLATGTSSAV